MPAVTLAKENGAIRQVLELAAIGREKTLQWMAHKHELEIALEATLDLRVVELTQPDKNFLVDYVVAYVIGGPCLSCQNKLIMCYSIRYPCPDQHISNHNSSNIP